MDLTGKIIGATLSNTMPLPLIIAHRGGTYWKGNNFSYIAEAVRDGADIIELDIRVRNGKYVIQHMPWSAVQGTLEAALKQVGNARISLDIKTELDINEFISYVHSLCKNQIIIGSIRPEVLARIQDKNVVRNYQYLLPWRAVSWAKRCDADWITPLCYVATRSLAAKIRKAGFKFVPSGNHLFKKHEIVGNQLKYARWGAYAIAGYHVKKIRDLLSSHLI